MLSRLGALRPLSVPDMRRLWLATALSLVGDGAYFVAIAWVALEVSDSPQALALIVLAWSVGLVVMLPLAGVTADRHERRNVLIGADVARALVLALMGIVALSDAPSVWILVILSGLHGAAESFFGPAFNAMIPQVVDRSMVVAANALEQVLRPLAYRLVGPAVGALLVALVDPAAALLLDALTFVASALLLARMARRPVLHGERSRARVRDDAKVGYGYVREHQWLLVMMVASGIAVLCIWGPLETLVPYRIREDLGAGAGFYAALLVSSGIGGIIGGLVLGQTAPPSRPTFAIVASFALAGLSLGGYAICSAVWQMLPLGFVFGVGMAYGGALWTSTLQRTVPGHLLGRVGALDNVMSLGLTPVSLALVGPLATVVGPRLLLGLAGAATALTLVVALSWASVRRLRLDDAPEPVRPAGTTGRLPDELHVG